MENKNRLVLLDILRAIGVMLMIEGHTIDAVMSPIYKDGSSILFQFWTFFRGLTAPFFFFSAGFAFVIATVKDKGEVLTVPARAMKRRLRRIIVLLLIGYGLHMPLQMFYDPSAVPQSAWDIFFIADALQIISLSLLVILLIALFTKKKENLLKSYIIAASLSLIIAPLTEPIKWETYLPHLVYPYLTFRAGSFFTFFPFSGYLFAGAAFSAAALSFPANDRARLLSKNFKRASMVSLILFVLFFPIQLLFVSPYVDYWRALPAVNFLRFGLVTSIAALVGYLSLQVTRFPKILPAIGKSSLTIYVVHLMIVYGSPVNIGLAQLLPGGVHPIVAVLIAVVVMTLMFGMVYAIEVYRSRRRRLAAIIIGDVTK